MSERRAREKTKSVISEWWTVSLPNLVSHPSPPCCLCLTGSRVTVVTRWAALRGVLHPHKVVTARDPATGERQHLRTRSSRVTIFFLFVCFVLPSPPLSYVKWIRYPLSTDPRPVMTVRRRRWPGPNQSTNTRIKNTKQDQKLVLKCSCVSHKGIFSILCMFCTVAKRPALLAIFLQASTETKLFLSHHFGNHKVTLYDWNLSKRWNFKRNIKRVE